MPGLVIGRPLTGDAAAVEAGDPGVVRPASRAGLGRTRVVGQQRRAVKIDNRRLGLQVGIGQVLGAQPSLHLHPQLLSALFGEARPVGRHRRFGRHAIAQAHPAFSPGTITRLVETEQLAGTRVVAGQCGTRLLVRPEPGGAAKHECQLELLACVEEALAVARALSIKLDAGRNHHVLPGLLARTSRACSAS
jgi:hypothetical protein